MTRILALTFGLLIAAAALLLLGADTQVADVAVGPPHDFIDDASREKLNGVLRDADR